MIDFAQRVKRLAIHVDGVDGGALERASQYRFAYSPASHLPVSLIMPLEDREFADNELFAAMDMNLPEGFLLAQIRERAPKTAPTKMQLLALMGSNGIGRLDYSLAEQPPAARPAAIERERLLRDGAGVDGSIFSELVEAYLETGSGLSGVQPKIIVPERGTFPIPNLIVKYGGPAYPGIAANEYLCLQAAQRAGVPVPTHALSADASLLVIDRFDLRRGGERLGFEDIAALLDLRVGGALSDRKYHGSYEDVADVLADFCTDPAAARSAFFDYLALVVMLRNGDGHLKNFGVSYDSQSVWLAPIYDLVATVLYPYERGNGTVVVDRTMALRLRRGKGSRAYPQFDELLSFGRDICAVADPGAVIERLRAAIADTLDAAQSDERISRSLIEPLAAVWTASLAVYRS